MRLNLKGSMIVLLVTACAGCADMPPPQARMASSEAAIRGAREVGAESVPSASLYLRLAEEQLAKAKAMMAAGDNEGADITLQRAKADAELALSLTRETTASVEAAQLVERIQQIRNRK